MARGPRKGHGGRPKGFKFSMKNPLAKKAKFYKIELVLKTGADELNKVGANGLLQAISEYLSVEDSIQSFEVRQLDLRNKAVLKG